MLHRCLWELQCLPIEVWPQGEQQLMLRPVILPYTCFVTSREGEKKRKSADLSASIQ